MDDFIVLLVLILWVLPAIASASIGSEKGRGFEGLVLGALFGVFGLLATGLLRPSASNQANYESRVAMYDRIHNPGGITTVPSFVSKRCVFCMSSIDRLASVCAECGRELPLESINPDGGQQQESVEVSIKGVSTSDDAGSMLLVVEPGWLTVNICDDNCESEDHELFLDTETAATVVEAIRDAVYNQGGQIVKGPYNSEIQVQWVASSPGSTDGRLKIDWATKKSHHITESDDLSDYRHEILALSGGLALPNSQLGIVERSLAFGTQLATRWKAGEISSRDVQLVLQTLGQVNS